MNTVSFTDDHLVFFHIYSSMTKKQKNIAEALLWYFEQVISGTFKKVYPTIFTIAKHAKCSDRTVNSFISKYEGIILNHENRIDLINKKQLPNVYGLNKDFFEFLWLMRACGFTRKFKELKNKIEIGISEHAHYLCSYLYEKGQLRTNKFRTEFISKFRTIESFFSYLILRNRVPKNEECIKKIVQEDSFKELKDIPLAFADKERLSLTFSILSLRQAKKEYINFSKTFRINNPVAFIYSKAKKFTLQTFGANINV